jgi:thiamine biosynthesis lipoprotein
MSGVHFHVEAVMGTIVTFEVLGHADATASSPPPDLCREAVARAVDWFHTIEQTCTRFDPQSELRQLSAQIGVQVPVSTLLFEAVQFALGVAKESGGAFDPTVGHRNEARGIDREFRRGKRMCSGVAVADEPASFRDVGLDPINKTVVLSRPLVLDLGAVAKGLAIDLAARELRGQSHFSIDAGGDLYLGGCNAAGQPWSVGIRHPRDPRSVIETLHVSDAAVCTSGDYERRTPNAAGLEHHILDPRTGASPTDIASATVVAASAMVADALATAAFVLGPTDGLRLLERNGVEGIIFTRELERFATAGMRDQS